MPPRPSSILHFPTDPLAACIVSAIERDTRGCDLSARDRFNFFPATPMATVSWVFEGELHLIRDVEAIANRRSHRWDFDANTDQGQVLPSLTLSGPQRRPLVSWSPGPVHALMVSFFPEALAKILGRSISPWIDHTVPLAEVSSGEFLTLCRSVLTDQCAPFLSLQSGMLPSHRPPTLAQPSLLLADWMTRLSVRISRTGVGRSLRQWQRRMHDLTGQSERDLQLMVRAQEAFLQGFTAEASGVSNMADLAAAAGFADQSHMGREVRRVAGFSPRRFADLLRDEESFWCYRLMAQTLVEATDPKAGNCVESNRA